MTLTILFCFPYVGVAIIENLLSVGADKDTTGRIYNAPSTQTVVTNDDASSFDNNTDNKSNNQNVSVTVW